MAVNKRITECTEDTSPVFGDWLATVDVSDTTDSVDGTTKKAKSLNVTGRGINPQTGTTYTYLTTDFGKLVTHNNGASIAGTLPVASATFPAKWYMFVQNYGVGVLTITPTTSTIDGAASLVLNQNEGALIVSDGTNYFTMRGKGGSGGGLGGVTLTGTPTSGQVPTATSGTAATWQSPSAGGFIGCRVYGSANQSIPNATVTALSFNTERYDTDVMHDNSTNPTRMTCKTAGTYSIKATLSFATNATGWRAVYVRINGTNYVAASRSLSVGGVDALLITIATDYVLAVNDYVEIMVEQNSSGALNVVTVGNSSYEAMMHLI